MIWIWLCFASGCSNDKLVCLYCVCGGVCSIHLHSLTLLLLRLWQTRVTVCSAFPEIRWHHHLEHIEVRGISFFLFFCSLQTGHASLKGVSFWCFLLLSWWFLFFSGLKGGVHELFLLNVCLLLSHQYVYPCVSGQQCICTMWLCLQTGALYSLSFPDLSPAHTHQSNLCNSMPCFPFFSPPFSLLAFGQSDYVAYILYIRIRNIHLSCSVSHYAYDNKTTSLDFLLVENFPQQASSHTQDLLMSKPFEVWHNWSPTRM